jgi:CRISPR system Cascade subunit CasE
MSLYFSRLSLARDAGNAALSSLLDPADPGEAKNAHHRLLWTLFADGPDRIRDFLWRAEGKGRFFTLSHRPPQPHDLFDTPEVKEFAPALSVGDRLTFVLRANATKDRSAISRLPKEEQKSRRVDLVMDLLRAVPKGDRAEARQDLAKQAAEEWFTRQGVAHGFASEELIVNDYTAISLPRQKGPRDAHAKFGILDLSGTLRVTDPAGFVTRLGQGFGRARAFGCGLMLIRRA